MSLASPARTATGPATARDARHAAYRRTRDRRLRDAIVTDHLPLARRLAARFRRQGHEREDLEQTAFLALVRAVERFDPDRGVPFVVYARATVLGELRHHLRDQRPGAHVPRRLRDLDVAVRRCAHDLRQQLGREPTYAQIAAALHVDLDEVLQAVAADRASHPIPLGDHEVDDPVATAALHEVATRDELARGLRRLTSRERRLLRLRYTDELSQRAIGERLGVSQVHVSRLLRDTLARLRTSLTASAEG